MTENDGWHKRRFMSSRPGSAALVNRGDAVQRDVGLEAAFLGIYEQRTSSDERFRGPSARNGQATRTAAQATSRSGSGGRADPGTSRCRHSHPHQEPAAGSTQSLGIEAARARQLRSATLRIRLRAHIDVARSVREILEESRAEPPFHFVVVAVVPIAPDSSRRHSSFSVYRSGIASRAAVVETVRRQTPASEVAIPRTVVHHRGNSRLVCGSQFAERPLRTRRSG